MNINDYSKFTATTAIYPEAGTGSDVELSYLTLGLCGETGEVAEKIKKKIRDGTFSHDDLVKELGDVYWYLARLSEALEIHPSDVLHANMKKLNKRKEENKLQGNGDNR